MDFHKYYNTDTDLGKCLNFIDSMKRDSLYIEYEDWDNMGAIFIGDIVGDGILCFQFHDDGSFRCCSNNSGVQKHIAENLKRKQDTEIKRMSIWKLIKYKYKKLKDK
jgi:hypothetical protein